MLVWVGKDVALRIHRLVFLLLDCSVGVPDRLQKALCDVQIEFLGDIELDIPLVGILLLFVDHLHIEKFNDGLPAA